MSPVVVPERTVDAWTSAEILQFDPLARVWAPTPRSQADNEIWDFAVSGSRPEEKLFVLENKGLAQDRFGSPTHVSLDLVQLARLVALYLAHDLPGYYGLPALDGSEVDAIGSDGVVGRASLRMSPRTFGEWQKVGSALDLLLHDPVWEALRRGKRSFRLRVQEYPDFEGIRRFLALTVACQNGWRLEDGPFTPPPRRSLTGEAARSSWQQLRDLARRAKTAEAFRSHLLELEVAAAPESQRDAVDKRLGQLLWATIA